MRPRTLGRTLACAALAAAPMTALLHGTGTAGGRECFGRSATIVRGDAANTIQGTPDDDVIVAGDGNDVVYGKGGKDRICGERGRDSIFGLNGNDRISGGPGNDDASPRLPNDYNIDGLFGGAGSDRIIGGAGNDHVWADFNAGNQEEHGADSPSAYNVLEGGDDRDTIFSTMGSDDMYGNKGNDVLHDAGTLKGSGNGKDLLNGGRAFDECNTADDEENKVGCETTSRMSAGA